MEDKERILSLIHKIAAQMVVDSQDCDMSQGLYGEVGGKLLFMSYYARYFNNKYEGYAAKYLQKVLSTLSNGIYSSSFCQGSSGLLYLLKLLNQERFIAIDISEAEEYYSTYIEKELNIMIEHNDYDFLYGASGIIYYLITIEKYCRDNSYINNAINVLLNKAVWKENLIFWEDKFNGEVYNISLAHGMSSILLVLSEIYKRKMFSDQSLLRKYIIKAGDFILSQKNKLSEISSFPNVNDLEESKNSRLAWCYGDLGIGISLWHVGNNVFCNEYKEEAISVFKKAEIRRNLIENRVFDACFCHGSSGITQIFRRMYSYTNIKSFLEASNYWLLKTIEFYINSPILFEKYENDKYFPSDFSLLNGKAGIGMALMSSILGRNNYSWDRIFLL